MTPRKPDHTARADHSPTRPVRLTITTTPMAPPLTSAGEAAAAVRCCASYAVDAADLRLLCDALGLDPKAAA